VLLGNINFKISKRLPLWKKAQVFCLAKRAVLPGLSHVLFESHVGRAQLTEKRKLNRSIAKLAILIEGKMTERSRRT